MPHKIILCDQCNGCGRHWKRGEPKPWRAFNEGPPLDKYGNAEHPGSKLVDCEKCKKTGRLRVEARKS